MLMFVRKRGDEYRVIWCLTGCSPATYIMAYVGSAYVQDSEPGIQMILHSQFDKEAIQSALVLPH